MRKGQTLYKVRENFEFYCGFNVNSHSVERAASQTSQILSDLPSTLFRSIDYKTTSATIGAIFCSTLATELDAFVNPIEKGHPDIIPVSGEGYSEEALRNYPEGLEIKCTVGNIEKGANLRAGQTRIGMLTGITWQAHHREVKQLLGLIWDFVSVEDHQFNYPMITGAFYTDTLEVDDWGNISGTTGRNTKVSGMTASGRRKMGQGWTVLLNRPEYIETYSRFLGFTTQGTGLFS